MMKKQSVLDRLKGPTRTSQVRYFSVDECEFFRFSDKNHLKNHLNYLLHSDSKDKYTNADSYRNKTYLYIESGMELVGWNPSHKERAKCSDQLYRKLVQSMDALCLARVECRNPKIFHWNAEMEQEMFSFVEMIRQEGLEPLVVQIHDDQPDSWCHFHVIAKQCKGAEKNG